MLKRSTRETRSDKHTHEFNVHNVGADLQRQVCRTCGHVSINPLPPPDLRAAVLDVKTGLFSNSELTVRIVEAIEPVLSVRRFGERRNRR